MELSVVLNPATPPLTGRKVVAFNQVSEAHFWFYLLQVLVSLMEHISFLRFAREVENNLGIIDHLSARSFESEVIYCILKVWGFHG